METMKFASAVSMSAQGVLHIHFFLPLDIVSKIIFKVFVRFPPLDSSFQGMQMLADGSPFFLFLPFPPHFCLPTKLEDNMYSLVS